MKVKTLKLNSKERTELKKLRKKRSGNISERAEYILKLSQGLSMLEISRQHGRNRHTIEEWVARYFEYGVEGLISKKQPGRPNKKEKHLLKELPFLLDQTPLTYGYQHSGWQVNLLVNYFSKQGLKVSETTIKRALKKGGWVYKRFSKTVPTDAPGKQEKRAKIKKMIKAINKERKGKESELFFLDESHFSNEPYVARGWFYKGQKKRCQQ